VSVAAMLLLALLDLAGALAAKEAVVRRSWPLAGVGVVIFLLLFWVYASSLQYADLGLVTLGWVVMLQVGVVLLDRYRYGAHLPRGAWLAVAVLLAAQGYLLLAPARTGADPPGGDAVGTSDRQVTRQ